MADWLSAFKYAARGLRRQPTFLAVSLLTLALGIGATTAIFSVIKAVVLNPLPYDAPDRIAVLWEVSPEGNQERVSVPTFDDWTARGAHAARRSRPTGRWTFRTPATATRSTSPGVRATPDAVRRAAGRCRAWPHLRRRRGGGGRRPRRGAQPRLLVAGARRRSARRRHDDPARRRAVHRGRRDAARVRVPDGDHRRGVDAAGLRSQGHPRRVAAGPLADGGGAAGRRRVDARRHKKNSACWRRVSPAPIPTATRAGARASWPRTSSWWRRRVRRCWC